MRTAEPSPVAFPIAPALGAARYGADRTALIGTPRADSGMFTRYHEPAEARSPFAFVGRELASPELERAAAALGAPVTAALDAAIAAAGVAAGVIGALERRQHFFGPQYVGKPSAVLAASQALAAVETLQRVALRAGAVIPPNAP